MSTTTSYSCPPGFAEYPYTAAGLFGSSPRFRRTESRRERQQRRFEERLAIVHALAACADAPEVTFESIQKACADAAAEAPVEAPIEASSVFSKEELHEPESRSSVPPIPLTSYSFESHPLNAAHPSSLRLLRDSSGNDIASAFVSAPCGRGEPCDGGHVAVAIRNPANAGESRGSSPRPSDSPTVAKQRLGPPPSAERPLTTGGAGAPPIAAEDLQWAWRLLVVGGNARRAFDSDSARAAHAQARPRSRGSGERGHAEAQRCAPAAEKRGNIGERWGGLEGLAEREAEERVGEFEGGAGAERKFVGLRQVGGSRTWAVPSPPGGDDLQQVTAAQRRRQRVRQSQWLLRWLQQQEQQQVYQHHPQRQHQHHQHQQQRQQQPSCGLSKQEPHAFPLSDAGLRGDGAGDHGGAGHAGVSARLGRLSLSSAPSAERRPFRQLSPFEATSREPAPLAELWERKQAGEARRIALLGEADGSADADADADADARRRVEGWFRGCADANISAGTDVADASARRAERGDCACADSVADSSACANPRPVPRKHFPSPLGRAWSAREAGERVLLRPAGARHAQCGGQTTGGWFEAGGAYAPRYSHGHGTQRSVQRSRSLQERRGGVGVASRHDFPDWQDESRPKRGASCGLPQNLGGGVVTQRAGYTQEAAGGQGRGGRIFGKMTFGDARSSQGSDAQLNEGFAAGGGPIRGGAEGFLKEAESGVGNMCGWDAHGWKSYGSDSSSKAPTLQAPLKSYPGPDADLKAPSHRHGNLSFSEWVSARSSVSASGLRTRGMGDQGCQIAGSDADVAAASATLLATGVASVIDVTPAPDAADGTEAPAATDVTSPSTATDTTAPNITAADTTYTIAAVNNGSAASEASDVQATRRDATEGVIKHATGGVTECVTAVCVQPSGADFPSLLPASEAYHQPWCEEKVLLESFYESAQESPEACGPFCGADISVEPRNLMPDEEQGWPDSDSAQESPEAHRPFCRGDLSVEPQGLVSGEEQGNEEQGKDHHSRCPSFSLWVSPTPRLPPPSSPLISRPTVFAPLTTPPSHPLDSSSPSPLTNSPFLALTS